jgi:hypothetical protein
VPGWPALALGHDLSHVLTGERKVGVGVGETWKRPRISKLGLAKMPGRHEALSSNPSPNQLVSK